MNDMILSVIKCECALYLSSNKAISDFNRGDVEAYRDILVCIFNEEDFVSSSEKDGLALLFGVLEKILHDIEQLNPIK